MNSLLKASLAGGLVGGAVDITYACLWWWFRNGVGPVVILQSVASGWLGAKAFEGGLATAALGLASHFGIVIAAAALYCVASRPLPFLARSPWIWGPAYGVAIYGVMRFVVLPLSAYPSPVTFPWLTVVTELPVHAFGVGLPIALAARRFHAAPPPSAALADGATR